MKASEHFNMIDLVGENVYITTNDTVYESFCETVREIVVVNEMLRDANQDFLHHDNRNTNMEFTR